MWAVEEYVWDAPQRLWEVQVSEQWVDGGISTVGQPLGFHSQSFLFWGWVGVQAKAQVIL